MLNDNQLKYCIYVAYSNWHDWMECYIHKKNGGKINELPVVSDSKLFKKFCREYSVLRGIKREKREEVRKNLISSDLSTAFQENSEMISKNVQKLSEFVSRHHPKNHKQESFSSKIASFCFPEEFVAMDSYSSKGAKKVINSFIVNEYENIRKSTPNDSYDKFCGTIRTIKESKWWRDQLHVIWEKIPDILSDEFDKSENKSAFNMRLLDVTLMIFGDRWEDEIKNFDKEMNDWEKELEKSKKKAINIEMIISEFRS